MKVDTQDPDPPDIAANSNNSGDLADGGTSETVWMLAGTAAGQNVNPFDGDALLGWAGFFGCEPGAVTSTDATDYPVYPVLAHGSGTRTYSATLLALTDGAISPSYPVPAHGGGDRTYSATVLALTDGAISPSLLAMGAAVGGTSATGTTSGTATTVSPDTSGLNPTVSVNAANPADVKFTVSGLASDYSGTVTFTDSTGNSDVVPISSDGNYSANLSNLANGTITYLMTVSDPAGNIINVDPSATLGPSGYADGAANAPAGTPQLPNLFSSYAVRPPWEVAGVDYAVGVPAGTVLKDPAVAGNMPAGVSVSTSAHTVYVTGNNVTLNGFNFSLEGGWSILIEGGVSGTTIENCDFVVGTNNQSPINALGGSSNLTLLDNSFNCGGSSNLGSALADAVFYQGTGTFIAEYNYFSNTYGHMIDFVGGASVVTVTPIVEYNVFEGWGMGAGSHGNPWYMDGNDNITNGVFNFNTIVQPSGVVGGNPALALPSGESGVTITNTTLENNVAVQLVSGGISYIFGGGGTSNNIIQDNYYDPTGTFGTFAGPYVASDTITNNVDMVNGAAAATPSGTLSSDVTQVVASPSSGVEVPGNTVTFTLDMAESYTVTGTPTLTLNDGGTATYVSGSGTSALTFSYMVAAGQTTSALAITAVNLPNGANIYDAVGNAPNLAGALVTFSGLQVAAGSSGPTLTSVTESPLSGDLDAGKTVTLTLDMSEVVTVNTSGGSPTLTLNDGGTATYVSGSGSSALVFSYTVAAGQNTSALAATAVNLNGATIKDGSGNVANLSLSGLTQSGAEIDTTAPTASSVTATAGDYDTGKTVTLTLNMSEAVDVTGSPTLTLNDGGTATYVSGSGSSALVFSYTVAAGQNTSALEVTGVTGTIKDLAGNALSTTGLPETFTGVIVDTTAPTVSSVTATAGDYDAGKALTLTLTMSEAVNVTGTPTLALNDGGTATYVSGSGSSALVFSYTVAAGQNTSALEVTGVTGTIKDLAGNALSTTGLPETFTGVIVDTTAPTVSSVTATAGDYDAGKTVTLTLNMSEAATVTGTPTLTLNDGGTATYVSGSGSSALVFNYTVLAGQNTAALQATAVTGTITDLAGNALSTSSLPQTLAGVIVNTTAPVISAIAELPSSGDLDAGKTVTYTLSMSEVVTVNTTGGMPTLTLNDGGTATYTGGSGTSALTFSYTVGAGQNTAALAATAVNLNGATIADGSGNTASFSLTGLTQTGPQIDTTTPTISSIAELPSSGDVTTGNSVTLTLNMSEVVTVAGGTPTLTLNDGKTATYVSGSGTNTLTFNYTVATADKTSALATTAVNLNGATIADVAGNAANLSLTGLTQTGPQINTTTPTISSITELPSSGDVTTGNSVTLTLGMNEAVTVNTSGGTPTLTLNDGETATYVSGSGTNALTFNYTVGGRGCHRGAGGDGRQPQRRDD